MDTRQCLAVYRILEEAKRLDLAEAFLNSSSADVRFVELINLKKDLVPAFTQALINIRDGK